MRKLISSVVGIAITASALAAPAADARHRHWRDRGRIDVDATDVIAGVLILGTIAAIANDSEKRKRDRRDDRVEPPYDSEVRYDSNADYDRNADQDRNDEYERGDDYGRNDRDLPIDQNDDADAANPDDGDARGRTEAGRAADACAVAAERRLGGDARTTDIDNVSSDGSGWSVSGRVTSDDAGTRDFQCSYRAGRVSSVSIDA